jgi:hypothetical protein
MGVYDSSNPSDWAALDGIYIDETSPPPSVTGVPTSVAILVGQFERGSGALQSVGSTGELYELYGNNLNYSGNVALQNKQFGLLNVVRVIASQTDDVAVAASITLAYSTGPVSIIEFTALWEGAYGNNITVAVAAGSVSGSKYTIHDGNPNAVFPDEVYDNVVITSINVGHNPFANSNLVAATVIATSHEPSAASATAMSGGSDGTIESADYQAAIAETQVAGAGNILFLDVYSTTYNGYLKTSMAAANDKMAVLANASNSASASAVITDVATYRDAVGRMIYAFPGVYTTIAGISTLVSPAPFYASLLSQIAPQIDPAYAANTQFLQGIESLAVTLQRSDYINLAAAGISAFEIDPDVGPKVKSGVVTQIANSSLIMVFRRRMTDYIIQSLAKYLVNYQNAVNSQDNRTTVGASITAFNSLLESGGQVPKDSEVQSGKASLIDTQSLNTDGSVGAGYFKILYKRRIYSSMRFIVLQAEIGETVVVTESNG